MSVEIDALGREHGVRVLVSDFGNAILKGVPYNRTGNTGTLAYSAPETLMPPDYARRFMGQQAQAASGSSAAAAASAIEYDERADLWSCGQRGGRKATRRRRQAGADAKGEEKC